jgi:putative ABC transport system ATP-binding protein
MISDKIIQLKAVRKSYIYDDEAVEILKEINLEISKGEFVLIMGPSGSGKSSLLNIMGLLDTASSGEIFLEGRNINQMSNTEKSDFRRNKFGFIFQNYNLLPELDVYDNLKLPLMLNKKVAISDRKKTIEKALEQVGMIHRIHQFPSKLSGGEQQRIAIARSFINNPELLFADEPTGNVDKLNEQKIIDLLVKFVQIGNSVLVISHNELYTKYATKYYKLIDGKLELQV